MGGSYSAEQIAQLSQAFDDAAARTLLGYNFQVPDSVEGYYATRKK